MKKIIIYTTPSCVYCHMTKEFLEQNNIAYEEKDVSANDKAREEMVKKSGQLGVPVIDIDGNIIVGFDKKSLSRLFPPKADPPLAENNKK
ncbi:glutaredoxin family protein [Candidatus Wolfebacteria bacterium]|nr:glutaredoxin family protein [Candidatus Wolfebacteria bacterium]